MSTLNISEVYALYAHSVLRRAQRLLLNSAESQDVLQEVFMSLLRHPAQFEHRSSVLTWLYSATTHACLNRIRNHKTQERLRSEFADRLTIPPAPNAERLTQLRQLLHVLPDNLAQTAVYYYGDEMTHDEIAKVLGCSKRQVGNLIERLHKSMQTILEEATDGN